MKSFKLANKNGEGLLMCKTELLVRYFPPIANTRPVGRNNWIHYQAKSATKYRYVTTKNETC